MHPPPETRRPAADETADLRKIEALGSNFDNRETTPKVKGQQVCPNNCGNRPCIRERGAA